MKKINKNIIIILIFIIIECVSHSFVYSYNISQLRVPFHDRDRFRQVLKEKRGDIFFITDSSPQVDLKTSIKHDIGNYYNAIRLIFYKESDSSHSEGFNIAKASLFSAIHELYKTLDSNEGGAEWEQAFKRAFIKFRDIVTDGLITTLCQEMGHKEVNDLRNLVDYLRIFYKSFMGQDPVKRVDLERIFEIITVVEVLPFYRLYIDCEERAYQVFASEGEIFRAFLNLIRNAIEAMERDRDKIRGMARFNFKGAINIRAGLEGNYVAIKISDTGPGMQQEAVEAFRNGRPFSSKVFSGGRGLKTAKAIIEKNGGTINIESNPGKGTTFIIRLPAIEESVVQPYLASNGVAFLPPVKDSAIRESI